MVMVASTIAALDRAVGRLLMGFLLGSWKAKSPIMASEVRLILGSQVAAVNVGRAPAQVLTGAFAAAALCVALASGGCRARPPALLTADQAALAGLESLQRGEGTRAAQLLERARRQGKTGSDIERGLAAGYVLAGDSARAIVVLKRAVAEKPKDADLWHLLGSLELQSGDPGGVAALEKAADISGRWDLVRDLGEAYFGRGDAVLAAKTFERAWRVAPAGALRSQIAVRLGDIALEGGNVVGALGWYRKALAEDPSNAAARAGVRRLGRTKG